MSEDKAEVKKKEYELISAIRKVDSTEIESFQSTEEYAYAIKAALVKDLAAHILNNTKTLPVKLTRTKNPETLIEEYGMSICLVDEKRLIELLSKEIELNDLENDISELEEGLHHISQEE